MPALTANVFAAATDRTNIHNNKGSTHHYQSNLFIVMSTIREENAAYPDIEARTPVVHDSDVATETPSCCICHKTFYGRNLLMFVIT